MRKPTGRFSLVGTTALLLFVQRAIAFHFGRVELIQSTPQKSSHDPQKESSRGPAVLLSHKDSPDCWKESFVCAIGFSAFSFSMMLAPIPAFADGQTKDFKFPPIDFSDKNRCRLNSSSMGQANAARDKLYDLRQCELEGVNAAGFDLSGVIMTKTNLSKANLKEAYFSKGYLRDSNFDGADFSNAIVDRASFQGSSLKGTIFANAVLTGTSFVGADVEGADFTEAAIGTFDLRNLCQNPTLRGINPTTGQDSRLSAGCK